ncbi:MAG: ABC transporter permease [Thermogladius sp.]|nr:ABC transporter permease [Thermogladius sp.]
MGFSRGSIRAFATGSFTTLSRSLDGFVDLVRFMGKSDLAGLIGLVIVIAMGLIAATISLWPLPNPNSMDYPMNQPPSLDHLFGTDRYGRDVLSRALWGARVSLSVGVAAAFSAALLGTILGVVAGVYGGRVDAALSRVIEVFLMMPTFFLALLIAAVTRPSIYNLILVVAVTSWPTVARVVRGQVLSLKERQYVEASRALGASDRFIMVKHILPQVVPLTLSYTVLLVSNAMLLEAGLSYLGLGDPNYPSWGRMIYEGQQLIFTAWWVSVFPGAFLTLTVLGWNLLGDSLSRYLNPRRRTL